MAPVPFQHPVRYTPLGLVAAHLTSIVYLVYAIAVSLYSSYKSLGPAQDTRSRLAQRRRLVPIFFGLSVVALSVAAYTSVSSATLSYKTWAHEHGLDQPEGFGLDEEIFPEPKSSIQLNSLYILQWLSDTSIYSDGLEIVTEKARRFWWGQQVDLAMVTFSAVLSFEGRRRNIPLITPFLVLAHLVNLSFALNLFYLALLLTPSPLLSEGSDGLEVPIVPLRSSRLVRLRDKFITSKPKNWHLHPLILLTITILNYGSILLLPYAAGTPSFLNVALLTRTLTFLPLILPEIAPVRWGTIYSHPHDAYKSFTMVFQAMSAASFVLHVKSSITGLIYNTPNSHYHRHSAFIPWDVEERTRWERGTTAISKILGSMYDHPAVKGVACDVLICALSLGLWAAIRATNIQHILESGIPTYSSRPKIQHSIEDIEPLTPIKPDPEPAENMPSEHAMTLRRRGRPAKSRVGSVASSSGFSEEGTVTPGRKRGRPKKAKQHEEEKAYEPAPSETKELVEGDIVPANEMDWEPAALAWGLVAFAGLGSASAGVLGGECISR
ncbi:hypothetical protein GGS26DRAFT_548974 [Hypomontagnella submonticulosa]|nr:hypothetical protein GGS26DRAFT_548974 [Hypomontagnella submonticulosa]